MREITEESRDSQNRGETKRRGGKEGERERNIRQYGRRPGLHKIMPSEKFPVVRRLQ